MLLGFRVKILAQMGIILRKMLQEVLGKAPINLQYVLIFLYAF